MDEEHRTFVEEEIASFWSLQEQVKVLRHLLEESEAALSAKRPKKENRCLHSKKMLVSCGPRDNGMFDYQCMRCGEFL